MKAKKLCSIICVATITAGLLSGCGSTNTGGASSAAGTSASAAATSAASGEVASSASAAETTAAAASASKAASSDSVPSDEMTLEFFDVAANYQGDQVGWFAKVLKDNLNLKINVISPQVSGDAVYQTRASSGNLGDILILEKSQWSDCVKNGLVKDISADVYNQENLVPFKDQIDTLNAGLEGNDGKIYGIPTEMLGTSPTSYSQNMIYSAPLLRWDLYKGLGSPEIKDLDGLLDVLSDMMKKYPTNDAGDPCYAFSLWPDWDGGDGMLGIANVVQLTTWYNEKIKGSVILEPDNSWLPLTSKDGGYYKILKFLNEAQRRGLVDPDSGTQDWNSACAKMSAGQVYLFWYSWQTGFWNSTDRLKNGTAMTYIPVKDQVYYSDADSYYGSGRVWAVGSGVDDAKYQRILQFLNWYSSTEGAEFEHDGIEGFNYKLGDDGKYVRINSNALMDNLPVPEEYGGGGYNDGNNAINQWLLHSMNIDKKTGEVYNGDYWASTLKETNVGTKKEWSEAFDATDEVDYMKKHNTLAISPNVSVSLVSDTADISVIRNQCSEAVNDYSWRMIFAKDDKEFDSMWAEMTDQLNGLGFEKLMDFDKTKYKPEIDAKIAAAKK